MLLIVGIIGFVAGVVIFVTTALAGIMFLPLSGLSQSEPDRDGFLLFLSGGCLLMLCSLITIAIGLNRNKNQSKLSMFKNEIHQHDSYVRASCPPSFSLY